MQPMPCLPAQPPLANGGCRRLRCSGDVKKKKPGSRQRERTDGQREIKEIQADGEKSKEKGRHSETDRWTDRNK